MSDKALTGEIIGAAIDVHRVLGPGLLESAYHRCMEHELGLRGLCYESECQVSVEYKGLVLQEAYRADFLVENKIVVELKAIEKIGGVHKQQVLTYLKLLNRKFGLLINFNTTLLKNGVYRIAN